MADASTQTRPTPSRPDSAPEAPNRPFGLSMTQLSGSALAAVTSAVAASFLGVAGTLIGAAVGSVVTTVAGAAYESSLKSAAVRVRTVVVRPGRDGVVVATSQDDPGAVPTGVGADQVAVADLLAAPSPGAGAPRRSYRPGIRWAPVAVVAALGFVVALGVLTLTEGLLGHPVSNGGSTGTTIGSVVGAQTAADATPSPSATPTGTATTAPTAEPTANPTAAVTTSPTDGPTTDAGTAPATSDPTSATTAPSQVPSSAPAATP